MWRLIYKLIFFSVFGVEGIASLSSGINTNISFTSLNVGISMNANATRPSSKFLIDCSIERSVLFLPISHSDVKRLKIVDDGEELVDLLCVENPRIRHMSMICKDYVIPYEGCSKVRKCLYERLLTMLTHLPNNIGIAYQEGWRPLAKQKEYFDDKFLCYLSKFENAEVAYSEACKYVSPFIDNIPTHCTGAAIDMTLFIIKETGEISLLDLGIFDDTCEGSKQEEIFSENITNEQRNNRMLLLTAAVRGGFVNYGYEWWHYSYGDKAWAYVKNKKNALYGLVLNDEDKEILKINKADYIKKMQEKSRTQKKN